MYRKILGGLQLGLVFVLFQVLIGCKKEVAREVTSDSIVDRVISPNTSNGVYEVRPLRTIKANTTLIWESVGNKPFWITFNHSPCDPQPNAQNPDAYEATSKQAPAPTSQSPNETREIYIVTCTVNAKAKDLEYEYNITSSAPPIVQPGGVTQRVTPCKGCYYSTQ